MIARTGGNRSDDSVVIAIMDRLYLNPDYRGSGTGTAFIKFTENALRPFARSIMQHVHSRVDFSKTLLRMGYVETTIIFTKDLFNEHETP